MFQYFMLSMHISIHGSKSSARRAAAISSIATVRVGVGASGSGGVGPSLQKGGRADRHADAGFDACNENGLGAAGRQVARAQEGAQLG